MDKFVNERIPVEPTPGKIKPKFISKSVIGNVADPEKALKL